MIVFGERRRVVEPRRALRDLDRACTAARRLPPGLARRAAVARLVIDAGELWQGLADAAFAARGADDEGPIEALAAELTVAAARALYAPGHRTRLGAVRALAGALAAESLPDEIRVAGALEGYAFYAVYPEAYARAAAALRARHDGPLVVIGLRSIGTSLAAAVAAAADAGAPVTLRPVGHPFRREVRLAPPLARRLRSHAAGARFALVDEGPGLSGSSLGAAADWLEGAGVPAERIHFFPSHPGPPGPQASARHRARWERAHRHPATFAAEAIPDGAEDVSGGRWRARLFDREADWPPADPAGERRKLVFERHGRTWLAKFAGLGRWGEEKLARARELERAGFHPPVRELAHGFLVTEWIAGARPVAPADRGALLETVARYLAFLATQPAGRDEGAPPTALLEMARHNAGERLGPDAAAALDRWRPRVGELGAAARPVASDGRLHPWEWIAAPGGHIYKTDALDHACGHDLVGRQDLAWDVAGAAIELGLGRPELDRLLRRLPLDPTTLPFYTDCYLAFQLGAFTLAASRTTGPDASRLRGAADRYAALLHARLGSSTY